MITNEDQYTKTTDASGVITFTPKSPTFSSSDVTRGMKFRYRDSVYLFRYVTYRGQWLVVSDTDPYRILDSPLTAQDIVDRLNSGRITLVPTDCPS